MRAFGILLQAILGLVVVGVAWTAAAMIMRDSRIPMPGPILSQVWQLAHSGSYLEHVRTSVHVMTYALLPGLAAGVVLGALAGLSRPIRLLAGPFIVALAAAPLIALMPLLVLWIGLRAELNIVMVFIMTAFPVMNAVMISLATSPVGGARRMAIAVVHGLRWGVTLGVSALVVSEMLASQSGVGSYIMNAAAKLDAVGLAASIVMVVVPTVLVVAILQAIEEQIGASAAPEDAEPRSLLG